jgi:hypothetical protein
MQNTVTNKDHIFEKMRKATKQIEIKEDILAIVDKNPQLINTLSLKNLKALNKMYDDVIEKNNLEISRLKRRVCM